MAIFDFFLKDDSHNHIMTQKLARLQEKKINDLERKLCHMEQSQSALDCLAFLNEV